MSRTFTQQLTPMADNIFTRKASCNIDLDYETRQYASFKCGPAPL